MEREPIGADLRASRNDSFVWQAQHFRKVKCSFRGRHRISAKSCADLEAGAARSQGQQGRQVPKVGLQISCQVQHFRKDQVQDGGLSQGQAQTSWERLIDMINSIQIRIGRHIDKLLDSERERERR